MGFVFLEVFQAAFRYEAAALFNEGFPAFPAGMAGRGQKFVFQSVTARATHGHVVLVVILDATRLQQRTRHEMFFGGFGERVGAGRQVARTIDAFAVALFKDIYPTEIGSPLDAAQPPGGTFEFGIERFAGGVAGKPLELGRDGFAHGG